MPEHATYPSTFLTYMYRNEQGFGARGCVKLLSLLVVLLLPFERDLRRHIHATFESRVSLRQGSWGPFRLLLETGLQTGALQSHGKKLEKKCHFWSFFSQKREKGIKEGRKERERLFHVISLLIYTHTHTLLTRVGNFSLVKYQWKLFTLSPVELLTKFNNKIGKETGEKPMNPR